MTIPHQGGGVVGASSAARPPPRNWRRREREVVAGERSVCTEPTDHSEFAVDQVPPDMVAAVEPVDSCTGESGGGCLHAPVAHPAQKWARRWRAPPTPPPMPPPVPPSPPSPASASNGACSSMVGLRARARKAARTQPAGVRRA